MTRLDLDADNAAYAFAQLPGFITDLRVGPDGALYVLGQINGGWGVHRIGATP